MTRTVLQFLSRAALILLATCMTALRAEAAEHFIVYSGGLWLGIPFLPSGRMDREHDHDGSIEARLAYRYEDEASNGMEFAYTRGISWWTATTDYTALSASLVRSWPVSANNQFFVRLGVNAHHLDHVTEEADGTRRRGKFARIWAPRPLWGGDIARGGESWVWISTWCTCTRSRCVMCTSTLAFVFDLAAMEGKEKAPQERGLVFTWSTPLQTLKRKCMTSPSWTM